MTLVSSIDALALGAGSAALLGQGLKSFEAKSQALQALAGTRFVKVARPLMVPMAVGSLLWNGVRAGQRLMSGASGSEKMFDGLMAGAAGLGALSLVVGSLFPQRLMLLNFLRWSALSLDAADIGLCFREWHHNRFTSAQLFLQTGLTFLLGRAPKVKKVDPFEIRVLSSTELAGLDLPPVLRGGVQNHSPIRYSPPGLRITSMATEDTQTFMVVHTGELVDLPTIEKRFPDIPIEQEARFCFKHSVHRCLIGDVPVFGPRESLRQFLRSQGLADDLVDGYFREAKEQTGRVIIEQKSQQVLSQLTTPAVGKKRPGIVIKKITIDRGPDARPLTLIGPDPEGLDVLPDLMPLLRGIKANQAKELSKAGVPPVLLDLNQQRSDMGHYVVRGIDELPGTKGEKRFRSLVKKLSDS